MTAAAVRLMADLRSLAVPRAAGTDAERRLARDVSERLASLGYDVHDEPFTFDPRWIRRGYPVALLVAAVLVTWTPFSPSPAFTLALVCAVTLPVVVAAGSGAWRFDRGTAIATSNVFATRPGTRGPVTVVVAHLDSKSQRLSFAGRSLAAAVSAAGVLGLAAALALWPDVRALHLACAAAAAGALAASALAGYGNASPGALDNATGVAVLLELARHRAGHDAPGRVEWLVTGAEEDGLVGADRFLARHGERLRAEHAAVVNLDTVGGAGPSILITHRWRGGAGEDGLAGTIRERARELGITLVEKRVPFPAGVDSAVFARAGLPAVTLASGTWRSTFRHVHRPSDVPDRVDVATLERTVRLVDALLDARARS